MRLDGMERWDHASRNGADAPTALAGEGGSLWLLDALTVVQSFVGAPGGKTQEGRPGLGQIYAESALRIREILPEMHVFGIMLLDDTHLDVAFAHCEPAMAQSSLETEVEAQIAAGIFGWALRQGQLCITPSLAIQGQHVILHVLGTRFDRLGMFVGMLHEDPLETSPIIGALLALLLTGLSSAIESCTLHEKLREINRDLDSRIAERTAQLSEETRRANALAREAEAANVAKSAFLAHMSHEIRTPLNGVTGMVDMLLDTPLSDKQRQYGDVAHASAQTLLAVLNGILDWSKIESGKLTLEVEDVDLPALLDELKRIFSMRAAAKGLGFRDAVGSDIPVGVRCDPVRLRQVLTNLLDNAVKFTDTGDIAFGVEVERERRQTAEPGGTDTYARHRRKPQMLEEEERTGQESRVWLRFWVRDSGVGIPEEKQHLLFQKFSQVDGSVARQYGGTGLGLAIASQLVIMMGGALTVQSEVGQGAEFSFTVCLSCVEAGNGLIERNPQGGTSAAQQMLADFRLEDVKVLLVEDNVTNQQVACGLLEKLGVDVDVACNGAEALERVPRIRYDLVFMDCQMPLMDGFAATRRIRGWEREAGNGTCETGISKRGIVGAKFEDGHGPKTPVSRIPIVAMTAHALQGYRDSCLAAGMDDYLTKPLDIAALAKVLVRWLPEERRRKHRASPLASVGASTRSAAGATPYETSGAAEAGSRKPQVWPLVWNREAMYKRLLGDTTLIERVLGDYVRQVPVLIAALRDALRQGDREAFTRHAHTLKGASASVGAEVLAASALDLEQAAPDADVACLAKQMDALEAAFVPCAEAMALKV